MKKFHLLGATALALLTTPTFAQQAAPQASDAAEDEGEAIVVTAQRQSQTLQSVPIAVSAFNSVALEKQQIRNSSDLQLTLPNVVYTKTSFTSSSFTIRGVGDLCTGVSCDSALGIHVNGSPTPVTRLFETEFFDLERVEILRGPQGTLYGRNATSGVMNIITAKPDLSGFHANAEASYGNFNAIKAKGMVNAALGDTFGVRLAGFYQKNDGYTYNLGTNSRVDGRNMYAVRGSLRWEPSSDTTVDLMGYYFREKDNRLRIQKQLCHRDPTGVLGCLPDARAYEYPNANGAVISTLPSRQFLGSAFSPAGLSALGALAAPLGGILSPAFAALGISNLAGADVNAGSINPADNRVINSAFNPTYFTNEKQLQASLKHDFGNFTVDVQGLWSQTYIDGRLDSNQAVHNRAVYQSGLNTLAQYATGGIPALAAFGISPAQSAAYFAPIAAALIPNGPNGTLCTSVPDPSNTGAFGGHKLCSTQAPLTFDQSSLGTKNWSVESIVTSKLDGPFNFLVGATYLQGKTNSSHYYVDSFAFDYGAAVLGAGQALTRQVASNATGNPALATVPGYIGPTFFDSHTPDFSLKSYGIFGEAYFEASDKLKFTVGVRYNHDKKHIETRGQLLNYFIPFGTADAALSPYAAGYDANAATVCAQRGFFTLGALGSIPACEKLAIGDVTFSEMTGRAVIDYKISRDHLLYASYSRGYKSGGINPPLQIAVGNTQFKPEFVNAFELGSKNVFGGGQFTINATAFYYQYKGLQLSRLVNRTSINDNVDANIYGLELESIIRPARGWLINLGASYLKTKVSGDLFVQNPRDPAAGRSDVVIVKDLQQAFNCVVAPTGSATGALANAFVSAITGSPNIAFPANSGVTATGAFGPCGTLAALAAAPSAGLTALLNGGVAGPLPLSVTDVGIAQNIKGKQLPQAPNYKWNAGVQYSAEMGNGMSVVPRVDLIYTGQSFGNIFNGNVNKIQGYSQVNAQIQLNGRADRWFLRAYVQNLSDASPITGLAVGDQAQGVFTNIFTLEPRRFGLTAGVKF
jgi:iron complex outermembrane recepter protein